MVDSLHQLTDPVLAGTRFSATSILLCHNVFSLTLVYNAFSLPEAKNGHCFATIDLFGVLFHFSSRMLFESSL
jgi:hypothetical protein